MTYNTDSVWHSTLCLASARDTPYLGRHSMMACYDCFNEVIEPNVTVNENDWSLIFWTFQTT